MKSVFGSSAWQIVISFGGGGGVGDSASGVSALIIVVGDGDGEATGTGVACAGGDGGVQAVINVLNAKRQAPIHSARFIHRASCLWGRNSISLPLPQRISVGCVSFQLESGQPSRRLPFSMPKHSVFEGKSAHKSALRSTLREGLQLS